MPPQRTLKPTTTAPYAIAPLIATLFAPVVPVKTGTSHPCVDAPLYGCRGCSRTARTPCRPNVPSNQRQLPITPYPQTNDNSPNQRNCPLRHSPADCYIVRTRRSREDGNLASCPCKGVWAAPHQTNDNCPLRHSPADCYIVRTRRSREDGNLASLCGCPLVRM